MHDLLNLITSRMLTFQEELQLPDSNEGVYEVDDWNVSALSSGTYFYTTKTGKLYRNQKNDIY